MMPSLWLHTIDLACKWRW